MQLNPHHPARFWSHLGKAYFVGRRYAEAIQSFMHLSTLDAQQHAFLAASYGWLGDGTAAAAHAIRVRQLDPEFELQKLLATMHYANEADLLHFREGLTKAGL
jgi:adenylate cyclase